MRMPDQGLRFAAMLCRMRMLVPVAAVVMRVAVRRMRMAVTVMVVAMIVAVGVAVPRVAVPMLAQDHEDDHVDGHAAQRQEEHHCARGLTEDYGLPDADTAVDAMREGAGGGCLP